MTHKEFDERNNIKKECHKNDGNIPIYINTKEIWYVSL